MDEGPGWSLLPRSGSARLLTRLLRATAVRPVPHSEAADDNVHVRARRRRRPAPAGLRPNPGRLRASGPAHVRPPGDRGGPRRAAPGGRALPARHGGGRPAADLVAAGALRRPVPPRPGPALDADGRVAVQLRRRGGSAVPDAADVR